MKTEVAAIAMVLLLGTLATGCISMGPSDREMLAQLQSYGARIPENQLKSPVAAGALNVLPGIGNFYLAVGAGQSNQWIFGILNLVTWPVSILWGIPEAAIDAQTINKLDTVSYYRYNPLGKKKFQELKAAARSE